MAKKITQAQMAVLQKERDHTLIELEHLRAALKAEVEMEDVDNLASDFIERDKVQALIFTFERKLDDIDHAIQQAQAVGYGICEQCSIQIDPERLEIFPETTLCIDCKRERERLMRIR